MSDRQPLRFLTNPEPGVYIFNATDEQGELQKFTLSKDQLAGLAVEATRLALNKCNSSQKKPDVATAIPAELFFQLD